MGIFIRVINHFNGERSAAAALTLYAPTIHVILQNEVARGKRRFEKDSRNLNTSFGVASCAALEHTLRDIEWKSSQQQASQPFYRSLP